jgi:hypothetical protein
MSEEIVYITVEQAISCLNDGDSIHTFLNPGGALIGADWSREAVIETLKSHPDKIEIGGKMCRKMKHGLVVWRGDEPVFIEANESKILVLEESLTNHSNMEQYKIIVTEHVIDDRLQGFEIMQKPSSNVDYYGTNGIDTVFIQFKNGTSYIYHNVDKADIDEMNKVDSIGKFIGSNLKKYGYTKIDLKLVNNKH